MDTTPDLSLVGAAQIWDNSISETDNVEERSRQSLYVEVFQNMIDIVMKQEKFLFSSEEQGYLQKFETMSYSARYLLIRLCLCKRGKWHGLTSLEQRYKMEIGGSDQISHAIDELCGIVTELPARVEDAKHDVVDLTLDEDEYLNTSCASMGNMDGNSSTSMSTLPQQSGQDDGYIFAEDDVKASLPELLGCLTHEELKHVGKQMKVTKAGQNRSTLSDAILSNASNQSTLALSVLVRRGKVVQVRGNPKHPITLCSFKNGGMKTQVTVVRRLVSETIGRCIKITPSILELFDRLNIVFFRSTTHGSPLLLSALLTAFRKRHHVNIDYVRTAGVFASRQALLDYEEALALDARIDEAISGETSVASRITPKSARASQKIRKKNEMEGPLNVNSRVEGARIVRQIWTEVYDRWKALVSCQGEEEERPPGLERFDCGHILTRIVSKGAEALAILKEHEQEMAVLEALLAQRKWGRGRRGAWYDRMALVLMTHAERTQKTWERAMNVVIHGLQDDLTHMTYRPRLERRLTRLENRLRIPLNHRHKCEGQLKTAQDVHIEGSRVRNRTSLAHLDKSSHMKGAIALSSIEYLNSETPFDKPVSSTSSEVSNDRLVPLINKGIQLNIRPSKGKSLWIGAHGEEVSVEQFALEHYQKLGYKGFHSEGRIVSTVFGLLFWDVIFASVPGAFETPYQSAPLDIFEDSFYWARRDLISQRLAGLEQGEAHDLLEQVLEKEMPRRTLCIGVDWEFEREDLLEIVECLGGHALAIICQMICEHYGQWRGGVPDLLVWNPDTRECKFVEVKSPNDRLQENQKVWIDVLIGSGVAVDLCHVIERDENGQIGQGTSRTSRKKSGTIKFIDVESEDGFETETEDQDVDRQTLQSERKRACNLDGSGFTPKMRKLEVAAVIPRINPRI